MKLIDDPLRTWEGDGYCLYLSLKPDYVLGRNDADSREIEAEVQKAADVLQARVMTQDEAIRRWDGPSRGDERQ